MIFYSPYIGAEMLRSYKWDGSGSGSGWDLCVGLLYEHRFAVLIIIASGEWIDTGACFILDIHWKYFTYLQSWPWSPFDPPQGPSDPPSPCRTQQHPAERQEEQDQPEQRWLSSTLMKTLWTWYNLKPWEKPTNSDPVTATPISAASFFASSYATCIGVTWFQ